MTRDAAIGQQLMLILALAGIQVRDSTACSPLVSYGPKTYQSCPNCAKQEISRVHARIDEDQSFMLVEAYFYTRKAFATTHEQDGVQLRR